MSDLFSGLLGLVPAAAGGGLTYAAYDRLGNIGDQAWDRGQQIAQDTANMTQFKPFGVTTSTGGVSTTPDGSTSFNLTPEQLALQQQLQGGASSMFSNVLGGTAEREQSIYDRIRAMQSPEEERQRMAMEERMASQGRLGVTTAQYGGTPEQLALAKAQEEAQNSASVQAIQLAQQQQAQQANIGNQMLQGQYAPQAALMDAMNSGMGVAGLSDVARRQAANLYGQGMFGGLEAQLGAGLGQANLMGNLGSGLLSGSLSPISQADGSLTSGLLGAIGSIGSGLSGLFGGGADPGLASAPSSAFPGTGI